MGIGNTSSTAKLDVDGSAIFNESGSAVDFRVEGDTDTELLFIDASSDRVGISTTSPSHELEVRGEACIGPNAINEAVLIGEHEIKLNNSGQAHFTIENTEGTGLQIQNSSSGTALGTAATNVIATFESGGNVGIGITSPTATLDVDGSAIFNESGAAVDFRVEGDTEANLLFVDGSADNVGIGTSTPDDRLTISGGNIILDVDGDDDWTSIGNTDEGLTFSTYKDPSGNEAIFIANSSKNVGIAMTSPSVALDVTGSIEYTGTITDVSDKRLKENFESIDSVLTKIMKIKGLSYNMINDSLKRREYGVIAQDVQAVFPEMVTTVDPENGYLGVAYIQLIPVLLEATKEQQAIIEAQKKEIETQKAELKSKDGELKAELDSKTSDNAEEIEALKAQVQQLLQLIQQQESASVGE